MGLPPATARGWRRHPTLCVGEWLDASGALDWAWDQMTTVHADLAERFPQRAAALPDEFRDFEAELLHGSDCAAQYSVRLPDGLGLFVAVVEIYRTTPKPPTRHYGGNP